MTVDFPEVPGHPNRLPFEGCLTLVDVVSDIAPEGTRDHKVILAREAAEEALPGLLGMAVSFKKGWDGHNARQKCGVITSAWLDENRLMVRGFCFVRDFPELEPAGECRDLGMSFELADVRVADKRTKIWILIHFIFTGAAVMLRENAAYRETSFRWLNAKHRLPRSVVAARR